MAPKTAECCQKPVTACECLRPRALACDFCGRRFRSNKAYYESRAYRLIEGVPEECGEDSAVLNCERCEQVRMRLARRFQ
jgi:hypothetical protein